MTRAPQISSSNALVNSSHLRTENYVLGAFWKIVASFSFASLAGVIKILSQGSQGGPYSSSFIPLPLSLSFSQPLPPLPILQIAFVEYGFAAILLFFWHHFLSPSLTPPKPLLPMDSSKAPLWLHGVRLLCAGVGLIIGYVALVYVPLPHVAALSFMGPALTLLIAKIFLQEDITPLKVLAITFCFMGAFFILRPDHSFNGSQGLLAQFGLLSLLPILSTALISSSKVATRALTLHGARGSPMTYALFLLLAPATALPAFLNWTPLALGHWLGLFLVASLTLMAQLSTVQAFKYAGICFLTPFSFTRIVLSFLIGALFFGETLQGIDQWAGIGCIMMGVFLSTQGQAYKNHKPCPS